MDARPLNPFEMWMVRSNLCDIGQGVNAAERIASVQFNGYPRVAAEIERLYNALDDKSDLAVFYPVREVR